MNAGTTPEHPGTHHGAPRTRTTEHPGTARSGANAVHLQAKCQRMGGCGASSGFPKCVMGYDKHWRGVCCQIDTPDVHAGLSGVVVGDEAAPVATTRRDWSERGG
jgi:hypothetical protein